MSLRTFVPVYTTGSSRSSGGPLEIPQLVPLLQICLDPGLGVDLMVMAQPTNPHLQVKDRVERPDVRAAVEVDLVVLGVVVDQNPDVSDELPLFPTEEVSEMAASDRCFRCTRSYPSILCRGLLGHVLARPERRDLSGPEPDHELSPGALLPHLPNPTQDLGVGEVFGIGRHLRRCLSPDQRRVGGVYEGCKRFLSGRAFTVCTGLRPRLGLPPVAAPKVRHALDTDRLLLLSEVPQNRHAYP